MPLDSTISETTAHAVARAKQQAAALELEHAGRIEYARNRPTFQRVRDRDETRHDLETARGLLDRLETHARQLAGPLTDRDHNAIADELRAIDAALDSIVRRRSARRQLRPLPPTPARRRKQLETDLAQARATERTAHARRLELERELEQLAGPPDAGPLYSLDYQDSRDRWHRRRQTFDLAGAAVDEGRALIQRGDVHGWRVIDAAGNTVATSAELARAARRAAVAIATGSDYDPDARPAETDLEAASREHAEQAERELEADQRAELEQINAPAPWELSANALRLETFARTDEELEQIANHAPRLARIAARLELEHRHALTRATVEELGLEARTSGRRLEARARLEELRQELRAERISWGELAELQALAEHIADDDVELLEAAGVEEGSRELEAAAAEAGTRAILESTGGGGDHARAAGARVAERFGWTVTAGPTADELEAAADELGIELDR